MTADCRKVPAYKDLSMGRHDRTNTAIGVGIPGRQQPAPPIRPDAQDVQVHGLRRRHQSPATHDVPNARPPKIRPVVIVEL